VGTPQVGEATRTVPGVAGGLRGGGFSNGLGGGAQGRDSLPLLHLGHQLHLFQLDQLLDRVQLLHPQGLELQQRAYPTRLEQTKAEQPPCPGMPTCKR
jgi:hypothetical protein